MKVFDRREILWLELRTFLGRIANARFRRIPDARFYSRKRWKCYGTRSDESDGKSDCDEGTQELRAARALAITRGLRCRRSPRDSSDFH